MFSNSLAFQQISPEDAEHTHVKEPPYTKEARYHGVGRQLKDHPGI